MRTSTYSTSVEGRSFKKKLNKKKLHKEQGRPKKADRAKGTRWLKKWKIEKGARTIVCKKWRIEQGAFNSQTQWSKKRGTSNSAH